MHFLKVTRVYKLQKQAMNEQHNDWKYRIIRARIPTPLKILHNNKIKKKNLDTLSHKNSPIV